MEAFSLLKYWRTSATTTAAAAVSCPHDIDDENNDDGNNDDGPFFDLEFSVPADIGSTNSDSSEPVSPSEELLLKGDIVSEPLPVLNPKPTFSEPFFRLKSATNFRVLMLKLKKNKENEKDREKREKHDTGRNRFFVKCKIEEIPIKSVFRRDNSSKSCTGTKNKTEKPQCDVTGAKDKRFSKDAMQKYLKMVSKRYGEKASFFGEAEVEEKVVAEKRRDDSLVQHEDGIQSAILHCKRSFNSDRDTEMSILSRSISDPLLDHHKSMSTTKQRADELKGTAFEDHT